MSARTCGSLALGAWLALQPAAADYAAGLAAYRQENFAVAHDQWRQCAQAGVARCQYALGALLDDGLGVSADTAAALVWYVRAARQDYPDALMQLGFLFATGRGDVVQDPVRSWVWFARAAALGVPRAAQMRDRVGESLSQDEREQAQRLADEHSIRYHLQK